jgi:hypothetical protein
MREHALANGVRCIACPKLGCGLDRLAWPDVLKLLEKVFQDSGIRVTVYSL